MSAKKRFLLRLNDDLYDVLEKWAADELRSVNAQIEYLLHDAARLLAIPYSTPSAYASRRTTNVPAGYANGIPSLRNRRSNARLIACWTSMESAAEIHFVEEVHDCETAERGLVMCFT